VVSVLVTSDGFLFGQMLARGLTYGHFRVGKMSAGARSSPFGFKKFFSAVWSA